MEREAGKQVGAGRDGFPVGAPGRARGTGTRAPLAPAIAPTLRAFALATCVLTLPGCDAGADATIALRPDDQRVVAAGAALYRTHCAACHGARLEGQPRWRERDAAGRLPAPPHDASGHTWHHPDDLLFRLTKHGIAKAAKLKDYDTSMPAFEGVLTDAEIVAVLSWIKAQWPPEIRRQHDEINKAAARRKDGDPRS